MRKKDREMRPFGSDRRVPNDCRLNRRHLKHPKNNNLRKVEQCLASQFREWKTDL